MSMDGKQLRKKQRTHQTEKGTKASEGWVSWKEAVSKEDEDVLLARVEAKTLKSRVHADLPPNHGVPYPRYLQVSGLSW